jgi:predicted glycosyltransferase
VNVLFDLGHPAHLHFFRNLIVRLRREGHAVYITGRDKDILVELAKNYGLDVTFFGVARKGILNLGFELIYRQWHLFKIIRSFKPDAMMAIAGTFISSLGKLLNVPTYVFYDTEHATVSNLLSYPFATCTYVPQCYRKQIRWNHVRYNGYHELAYLHPNYFKPDPSVLEEAGLGHDEIFTIVRFVGWGASHDIGRSGFGSANKIRAVEELSRCGRVFISCEGGLPAELEKYRLRLNVTRIHDLMAYAALIFGESATMASEGAVLGVPGIFLDPVGRGYTDEQEKKYHIVFNFTPDNQNEAIAKAVSILKDYRKEYWRGIGRQIVSDKIDVTEMMHQITVERPFARKVSRRK